MSRCVRNDSVFKSDHHHTEGGLTYASYYNSLSVYTMAYKTTSPLHLGQYQGMGEDVDWVEEVCNIQITHNKGTTVRSG